tara:strand:- start:609 stop:845 length:237 start_codon:yes stop_codon:yes gene_type:complete
MIIQWLEESQWELPRILKATKLNFFLTPLSNPKFFSEYFSKNFYYLQHRLITICLILVQFLPQEGSGIFMVFFLFLSH